MAGVDMHAVLKQTDQLYHEHKFREAFEILEKYRESDDPDVLWQVVRIYYRMGKLETTDQTEAKKIADTAMELAEKALKINDKHFLCQKWTGIMLSWACDLGGQKMRIEKSYEIRDHFQKAIELKPDDAAVKHLMGRWCYRIASVSWLTRRAASLIFATPPSSSYEEALSYLEAAEKAQPGFFFQNWLWLGMCHQQLGHKGEARKWLKKAAENQGQGPDDKEAREQAQELLQKL